MKKMLAGFVFGLIAPVIGLFIGLQVSTAVGNLLTFPIIGVSILLDVPFGLMSTAVRLGAWLFSGIVWAVIFYVIGQLVGRIGR